MEKRALIAVILSMAILIGYYLMFANTTKTPLEEKKEENIIQEPVLDSQGIKPSVRNLSDEQGEDITISTPLYYVTFTTKGAAVKSFRLRNYEERNHKIKFLEKELNSIETTLQRNLSSNHDSSTTAIEQLKERRDAIVLLITRLKEREAKVASLKEELLQVADPERKRSLLQQIEDLERVELVPHRVAVDNFYPFLQLSFSHTGLTEEVTQAVFAVDKKQLTLNEGGETETITFSYKTESGLLIEKIFSFNSESYIFDVFLNVTNQSQGDWYNQFVSLSLGPELGLYNMGAGKGRYRVTSPVTYLTITKGRVEREKKYITGEKIYRHGVRWTAICNKYFVGALIAGSENSVAVVEKEKNRQSVVLRIEGNELGRGKMLHYNFRVYLGPQQPNELIKAGVELERVIDYGFWGPIAKGIYNFLQYIYQRVGNYGWSIVLLSLCLKILFFPLTQRTMESMKKMQERMKDLQPQLDVLREKHKDSPQKLNRATMELYKKHNVNAMSGCAGGCLPMLLQMPVFFALYGVLYRSIELRGAPFIGWIRDLSQPDPWRVLPILMGATMVFQQEMMGMGATGGVQQEQAKMMKWMMPVMLTVIFFGLPSGVVLYWLAFNIFTWLQQMLLKRMRSGH